MTLGTILMAKSALQPPRKVIPAASAYATICPRVTVEIFRFKGLQMILKRK